MLVMYVMYFVVATLLLHYTITSAVIQPCYSVRTYVTGFLIRFLAQTKLAQVKLWLNQYICNCSNDVKNCKFIMFLVLTSGTSLTILTHVTYFIVAPLWLKSYHTILGHRTPSCTIWCAIGPYQKPWYVSDMYVNKHL